MSISIAVQAKSQNRWKGKKAKVDCHLENVQKCLFMFDKLDSNSQLSYFLTTGAGFDKFCL